MPNLHLPINRRQVLALAGSTTGGLIIASSPQIISPLNLFAWPAESLPVKQGKTLKTAIIIAHNC